MNDPEIIPHNYSYLIFHKSVKTYIGRNIPSWTNVFGKGGFVHVEQ